MRQDWWKLSTYPFPVSSPVYSLREPRQLVKVKHIISIFQPSISARMQSHRKIRPPTGPPVHSSSSISTTAHPALPAQQYSPPGPILAPHTGARPPLPGEPRVMASLTLTWPPQPSHPPSRKCHPRTGSRGPTPRQRPRCSSTPRDTHSRTPAVPPRQA